MFVCFVLFFNIFKNCIDLFLAVLGLHGCEGFSPGAAAGSSSLLRCSGRSPPESPGTWASILAACGLLGSGAQARQSWHRSLLLHSMCDLPGSGIEPVFPALAGGFFTTETPGKPPDEFYAVQRGIILQSIFQVQSPAGKIILKVYV